MGITRREFIKIGAAATGAAALSGSVLERAWAAAEDKTAGPGTDGEKVVATFCEMCFWKCGVHAHVKDGKVTKIVGNPDHPLSNGHLCPRGTGGTGLLYDPDRLKTPLIRVEERGKQVFREASWDEALDLIAKNLKKVKEKYGPEALALFSHGTGASFFKTLLEAYGSASEGAPSYSQCRGARWTGFELTYGEGIGGTERTDMEHSRVITLIGTHLGENMHNTQVQEMATAIKNGAELVVVDPRYSTAAGKAKYWLPIKPGTDIALLLGWMHVIVNEGLYDRDYVEQYTTGFDKLKAHLADKTPEWAFTQTTIPADTIRETARFIAGARPASLIHPGRHTAWYGNDSQRARAMAIMNALLGSWGRRGGLYYPSQLDLPAYPAPKVEAEHEPPRAPDMPKDRVFPFALETLADGVRDAAFPGKNNYDIHAWMVYDTNLIMSLPQPEKTIEAIQNLDFIFVVDVLPTEITGWADVVLPEATYLERWDDVANMAFKRPFLAVRQEVVPPLYDSKPGWWIAKEIGKRLGLEEHFPYQDGKDLVTKRLAAGGYDVKKVLKTGVHVGEPKPMTTEDGLQLAFNTPSGKIELFSQRLEELGLGGLPDFTPIEEPPPGKFRLLFGRAPTQSFSRTENNRFLGRISNTNELWLNAQMAKEMGLHNGEYVVLTNQDGVKSEKIRLKVTQRIRPDCVYMTHGYGHRSRFLNYAKGRGADDQRLVTKVKIDPIMGGTGMFVNFVSIEKAVAA